MSRFKPARGKRKPQTPKGGAVGCVLAIALVLALIIWAFSAIVTQN